MSKYPNILSIMGEGRDVGKTLLACNIISKFGREHNIVGLKISPHKHNDTGNAAVVFQNGDTILREETDPRSQKDTGRMLKAGAVKAYLLQTGDSALQEAMESFFSVVGRNTLIVCESGKLSSQDLSGINLFVRQLSCRVCDTEKIPGDTISRIVTFTVNGVDLDLNNLSIENNCWRLKEYNEYADIS